MSTQQPEPHFKFEVLEHNGAKGINGEEAIAYAAYKTGLSTAQVRAVQEADFEYLKRCGLAHE